MTRRQCAGHNDTSPHQGAWKRKERKGTESEPLCVLLVRLGISPRYRAVKIISYHILQVKNASISFSMAITVRKYVPVERNCVEANGRRHALSAIDYAADYNAAVLLYY